MIAALLRANPYGWSIVALCFVSLACATSSRATLGLVMPVWEAELGWTRGFVSFGGALTLVMMAAVAPLAGNLVDRTGPRALLLAGLAATALGLALTAAMQAGWQFLLFYSGVAAVGFGMVANHAVSTVVAQNFEAHRGLATGAATAGSTAGQLLLVPLLALGLDRVGWRAIFAAVAAATLLLAATAWVAVRRPAPAAGRRGAPAVEPLRRRLATLATSKVFHALFWSFAICGFTTSGVIEVHLIPYAVACGFPPLQGAAAYGVLSAFNMLGMLGAGYLADRVNRPLLLGCIYIARGLCFLVLMRIAGDLPTLMLFAVAFGVVDYSTVPVTASLVASHLGLRIMGLTMGLLAAGHALGAAAGAFAGGYLFDLHARYDAVWGASVAVAILAGLLCFTIREDRRPAGVRPAPA